MRFAVVLGCALFCGVIGYFIGVYAGCDWLMTGSDLCGIYGMMLTGPLGLVVGALLGWRATRPPAV